MLLSIVTPTYNRADLLPRLYKSLVEQNSSDFEWVVVDDGSLDNTEELIKSYVDENKLKINYIKKPNGGKHTAYNLGVNASCGDLIICVDSDDLMAKNSIEIIKKYRGKVSDLESCAGFVAKKIDIDGTKMNFDLPDNKIINLYDLETVFNCVGDKCFIVKSDIAKNNIFPFVESERFFPEGYMWDMIGNKYSFYSINEVINECEYQEDGYSNNYLKLMLNNPTGFKAFLSQRIDMATTLKERLGYASRYNAFKILSNKNIFNYKGRHKVLTYLSYPIGALFCVYYKLKKRRV